MTARLDAELVRRGLARSRGQARELVVAGSVTVGTRVATKTSMTVDADTWIVVADGADGDWVSRGATKLRAALDAFAAQGLSVSGRRAADIGASTGGFTQVLLRRGAVSVAAVDVGHGQLVPELREDPRVANLEGHNVRDLTVTELGGPVDVLVADLSFISLRMVLPRLRELVSEGSDLVLLVKPQFEVGRERLGKAGIVRDVRLRRRVVQDVMDEAIRCSLQPRALVESPVTGTTGNVEYLLWVTTRHVDEPSGSWAAALEW